MSKTVIYDACVLYPASIRSFLMWIGHHELVHARWSDRILDECFGNILENRPDLAPRKLSRTRELMVKAVPDCLVEGFESRIEQLNLPDEDDRHVLAAAIEADADAIVTFNLTDFPDKQLQPHGLRAVHPDEFVSKLLDADAEAVLQCLQEEASIRNNPPRSKMDVCESLEQRGLPEAADRMRRFLQK